MSEKCKSCGMYAEPPPSIEGHGFNCYFVIRAERDALKRSNELLVKEVERIEKRPCANCDILKAELELQIKTCVQHQFDIANQRDHWKSLAMKAKEALKKCLGHSCDIEGADFGFHSCCNQRDYKGHKPDCYIKQALAAWPKEDK
jgi:hypothetical protein